MKTLFPHAGSGRIQHPRGERSLRRSSAMGLWVACVVIFPAQVALGQAAMDVKTLLGDVASAYTNLKQYEVTIVSTAEQVTKAGEKESDTETYKLTIARPDKIRMETNGGNGLFGLPVNTGAPAGSLLIVGRGDTVWLYAPELKRYGKATAKINKEAAELVGNPANWVKYIEKSMSLQAQDSSQMRTVRGDERISVGGKAIDCYVVQSDSARSKLWIDKVSELIVRRSDTEAYETITTDFIFGRVNVPLPEDLFILSPAADAKEEEIVFNRNPFY